MRVVKPGPTKPGKTRTKAVVGIVVGLILALIGWAWINGGREPLREISEPVPVPAAAQ